ncbi:hypothetical protein GGX14DRAFT_402189 [Mycena pura]|uniref:Uncharacterized protein n=1 Tax=Mycena pura TaxID=153505 RepID=A0AAD6V1A6_9AGAR|nr:hypothetical protein GGX14DRAFT_402189 [Mycena pura]
MARFLQSAMQHWKRKRKLNCPYPHFLLPRLIDDVGSVYTGAERRFRPTRADPFQNSHGFFFLHHHRRAHPRPPPTAERVRVEAIATSETSWVVSGYGGYVSMGVIESMQKYVLRLNAISLLVQQDTANHTFVIVEPLPMFGRHQIKDPNQYGTAARYRRRFGPKCHVFFKKKKKPA